MEVVAAISLSVPASLLIGFNAGRRALHPDQRATILHISMTVAEVNDGDETHFHRREKESRKQASGRNFFERSFRSFCFWEHVCAPKSNTGGAM
jgi:hypothetical protein